MLCCLFSYGQSRKIDSIVPERVKNKLYYPLVQSAIFYGTYNNTNKTNTGFQELKRNISSLDDLMPINHDTIEPTLDVLIKKTKGSDDVYTLLTKHFCYKGRDFEYITATLALKNLIALAQLDEVIAIEPSFRTVQLLNQSNTDIHSVEVWQGGPLANPLLDTITGKGVFVGIIDTKPNINHITFVAQNGGSRFEGVVNTNNFNYSQWSDPGHGTHVSGIAGGNGGGNISLRGVAPASKLLWFPSGTSNSELNALSLMKQHAGNQPLVINNSNGIFSGPRDGSLLIEEALQDSIIDNLIYVNAAGNQSTRFSALQFLPDHYFLHFQGEVPNSTSESIELNYKINPTNYVTGLENNQCRVEIWHHYCLVKRS